MRAATHVLSGATGCWCFVSAVSAILLHKEKGHKLKNQQQAIKKKKVLKTKKRLINLIKSIQNSLI